ncbi:MAG: DUF4375 domain-containing protein [Planctomycetes bacterium]|nr:DUF4375 domain-containing protein [Planctomycetota bacterium]
MDKDFLESASDLAFARLQQVGGEPSRLQDPFRTVVVVYSAQGVIDNGGLRYFFGNDWPGQPPYSMVADAYRTIGASPEALAIEAGALLFPFPRPERDLVRRCEILDATESERIDALDLSMQSDVWSLLAAYVLEHKEAFDDPSP